MKNNILGWFEIPVENMERAISFYEEVFDISLERNQMGPLDMAWFPYIDGAYGSGGSLVYHQKFYTPSNDGVVVYLTALSGDLENELSKVENAGGTILQHKTKISDDHGFMAVIHDSEGNRIALHSRA
jgi:hypothetical protein